MAYFYKHLAEIVPTTLPFAFVIVDSLLKLMLGQREFHFVGGDMALCGLAVLAGTVLQQLLRHAPYLNQEATVVAILGIVLAAVLWFVLLWIGSLQRVGFSYLAAFLGSVVFSLCGYAAWHMLP